MRTAGLLALAILLPLSAYAALININTADAALLDTLPGIGPAYATRIVDYRTAHGPFARIEDIQNVSGIGPSTYTGLAPFITVGNTGAPSATNSPMAASSTPDAPTTSSGGASTYTPPPPQFSITIRGTPSGMREVPLHFSARVTTKNGSVDPSAHIAWNFGDGSANEGTAAEKTYHYAGTYLVTATAVNGDTNARAELVVMITPAKVRLLPVSEDGITVANDSNERLDLSGWRLFADVGFFRIPDGTILLPESNTLFPFTITNLPVALNATLVYPDGVLAARSASPVPKEIIPAPLADEQLSALAASSSVVQTVERNTTSPAVHTSISGTTHEDTAVSAPAAATELAAAGAALPPPTLLVGAPTSDVGAASRTSSLFRSPWTLSFLGLMALAGGAFIFL